MNAIYNGPNSFRVFDNRTSEFTTDRRVKIDCGNDGVKYASVISSTYSAPYTTVLIDESDLTAALTDVWYSVMSTGDTGSLPDHGHSSNEGAGGLLDVAFTDLSDTPSTYSGSEGLYTKVNATGDGLEFAEASAISSFLDLTDTPATYSGAGNYILKVNPTESGIEFSNVAASGIDDHDHAAYVPWDFGDGTISGTGDIYCNDIYTSSSTVYIGTTQLTAVDDDLYVAAEKMASEIYVDTVSGSLQSEIDTKAITLLELTDTPSTYDEGKFLYSKADGTKWVEVPAGTKWLNGEGTPSNSLGDANNYYLDTISGSVHTKTILIYGSDQCSGGTPTASEYSGGYVPANAFDNNTSYASRWSTGNSPSYPVWLQYQFATEKQIEKLRMHPANDIKSPRDYSFRASNTGAFAGEETILFSVEDEPQWTENVWKEYEFTNDDSYIYYRIVITEINSGGAEVHLSEVEMMELDSANWELIYTDQVGAGSGGEGGSTTLSGLTDTPDYYDDGKYLRSTSSGTEWAAIDIPTFSGSYVDTDYTANALVKEWNLTSSGIDESFIWDGENEDVVIEFDFDKDNTVGTWLRVYPNNDTTAANYNLTQLLAGADDSFTSDHQSPSSVTGLLVAGTGSTADAQFRGDFSTSLRKGQAPRRSVHDNYRSDNARWIKMQCEWLNTVDDVTSIRVHMSGNNTGWIKLYKRTNISLPIYEPDYIDTNLYANELIGEWSVDNAALDVTLSGLDGDVDEVYYLEGMFTPDTPLGSQGIAVQFNGDSNTANYKRGYLSAREPDVVVGNAELAASLSGAEIAYFGDESTTNSHFSTKLNVKTGNTRHVYSENTKSLIGSGDYGMLLYYGYWNNTVDNVTSIGINSNGANSTGWVKLYRRVNLQLPVGSDATISGVLLQDGSTPLTGDWDYGSYTISGTGDIYCNDIYTSSGTVWIGEAKLSSYNGQLLINDSVVSGTDGVDGNRWYFGSGVPSNELTGNYDDFYLDDVSYDIYNKGTYSGIEAEANKYNTISMVHDANGFTDEVNVSDGSTGTYSQSIGVINGSWISIDLETPTQIIQFATAGNGSYGSRMVKDFIVQASDDNVEWVDVYTDTAPGVNYTTYHFGSASNAYRYWRVYTLTNYGHGSYVLVTRYEFFRLDESESSPVWGDPIGNIKGDDGADGNDAPTTFSGLTDTPDDYDDGKYLRSTSSGTEWATVSGITFIPEQKGKQSLQVEWATTSGIYVNPGTIHTKTGMYELNDRTEVTVSGLAVDTWYYVYTQDASTFTVSSGIPTIDYPNMGYYNGDDRCIGAIYSTSGSDISLFDISRGDVFWPNSATRDGWQGPSNVWTTSNLYTPAWKCKAYASFLANVSSDGRTLYYRTDSSHAGSGHAVVRQGFDNQNSPMNSVAIFANDDSTIEIKFDNTTTDNVYVRTEGFTLPDYIYTGA